MTANPIGPPTIAIAAASPRTAVAAMPLARAWAVAAAVCAACAAAASAAATAAACCAGISVICTTRKRAMPLADATAASASRNSIAVWIALASAATADACAVCAAVASSAAPRARIAALAARFAPTLAVNPANIRPVYTTAIAPPMFATVERLPDREISALERADVAPDAESAPPTYANRLFLTTCTA